jgi:hypothetical protein
MSRHLQKHFPVNTEFTGTIIILPKPGASDLTAVTNYRGISLLICLSKVFCSLLLCRLEEAANAGGWRSEEQAGFRAGYRTADNIFVLKTLIDTAINGEGRGKNKKAASPLFAAFIDFSKAYDYVYRAGLFVKMSMLGFEGSIMVLLASLYDDVRSRVRVDGALSPPFRHDVGVRQGCVLSPFLFAMFVDDFPLFLEQHGCEGVKMHENLIRCLMYADDIVLVSSEANDLQKMLYALDYYCCIWRLFVNLAKSEVMVFESPWLKRKRNLQQGNDPERVSVSFTFQGKEMAIVEKYKYLGAIFRSDGSLSLSIDRRVEAAGKAFYWLTRRASAFRLTAAWAARLYNVFVLSNLVAGGEIWGNLSAAGKADKCQAMGGRRILKVPRSTPSAGVLAELGWQSGSASVLATACEFWVRVIQMPTSRLPGAAARDMERLWAQGKGPKRCWLGELNKQLDKVARELNNLPTVAVGCETAPVNLLRREQESHLQWLSRTKLAIAQWDKTRLLAKIYGKTMTGNGIEIAPCCNTVPLRSALKLRTYALFKQVSNKCEGYLEVALPPASLSAVACFRLGVLPLRVETGRWERRKVTIGRAPSCPGSPQQSERSVDSGKSSQVAISDVRLEILDQLRERDQLVLVYRWRNGYAPFVVRGWKMRFTFCWCVRGLRAFALACSTLCFRRPQTSFVVNRQRCL